MAIQPRGANPLFRGRRKAAAGSDECWISCKGVGKTGRSGIMSRRPRPQTGFYDRRFAHSGQVQRARNSENVYSPVAWPLWNAICNAYCPIRLTS
jgi:hypothetical protein